MNILIKYVEYSIDMRQVIENKLINANYFVDTSVQMIQHWPEEVSLRKQL